MTIYGSGNEIKRLNKTLALILAVHSYRKHETQRICFCSSVLPRHPETVPAVSREDGWLRTCPEVHHGVCSEAPLDSDGDEVEWQGGGRQVL